MRLILIALFALLSAPAIADEVWDTPEGQVVYLADSKGFAILQLQNESGSTRFYFPGLAGNFDNRSVHEGFWIQDQGDDCSSTLTGPDGHGGQSWGEVSLVFHDSGFPTNWTMLLGTCFGETTEALRGQSPLL